MAAWARRRREPTCRCRAEASPSHATGDGMARDRGGTLSAENGQPRPGEAVPDPDGQERSRGRLLRGGVLEAAGALLGCVSLILLFEILMAQPTTDDERIWSGIAFAALAAWAAVALVARGARLGRGWRREFVMAWLALGAVVALTWALPLAVGDRVDGRPVVVFLASLAGAVAIHCDMSTNARRRLALFLLVAMWAHPIALAIRARWSKIGQPFTASEIPVDSRALSAPVAGPGDIRCDVAGCSFRGTCEYRLAGSVVGHRCPLHSGGCK